MLLITLNLVINTSSDIFNEEYRDVFPHPLYTVRSESRRALIKVVGSDVHES
jgi:hypothetical protein